MSFQSSAFAQSYFLMANISNLDIISSHPIKDGLCAFRRRFESIRINLGVVESSNTVQAVLSAATGIVAKDLVLDLILALQNEPAARILPSRNGHGALLRDLSSQITLPLLESNNFDIISAIPLVERVINFVSDVEIWNAVFDLVARTSTNDITPPTAFEKAVLDTPLRSSSASQRGIE
ncbi:hypothetical protein OCU04_005803 [Sclerotinia nivalis]|uniref:Uncharacterized protein n=1 Tax=Sclerotinia nivalis TaxID=352851 RepID=A0A9X0ALV1_9HELO|nr:hypothetical protein OCU04_005803 [Sclerotinia nivalis]